MIAPALLLLLSLIGVSFSVLHPEWSDLLLLAVPCAMASAILVLRAFFVQTPPKPRKWAVMDGSNVMYWKDDTPQIQTIREVVKVLKDRGFTVGVMFDANAGYLLEHQYIHDERMGRMLGLPTNQIMVVPKGTPADPYILQAARDLGARIVSNDRFRDWAADHPEVTDPGYLIKGGYHADELWLALDAETDIEPMDPA